MTCIPTFSGKTHNITHHNIDSSLSAAPAPPPPFFQYPFAPPSSNVKSIKSNLTMLLPRFIKTFPVLVEKKQDRGAYIS